MDLTYPPEADAYRSKIKAFLAAHLPADWRGVGALADTEVEPFNRRWREVLYRNGFLAVNWPPEYGGGGLSPLESVIVAEEFALAGVPTGSPNDGFGIGLLGNTLLRWGTEEQKRYYLPKILSGEHKWCQGYSEPNAGSDLGNLGLRAVLDGDVWVLNGQKIWTTAGRTADHIFALCRTDPEAPKHKGISFLLCDIDQPGVEVRPIRMMSGESEFCEVFFTDATVAKDDVVGGVNNGWAVAMTLLGHERGGQAATNHIGFKVEYDKLVRLARQNGKTGDPVIRQRLAKMHCDLEVMRYLGLRTLTDFLAGRHPGPEASLSKVIWSEYHRRVTELAVDILGADALVSAGQRPRAALRHDVSGSPNDSANWLGVFYVARAGTIYAGSNEVQRGVIGEQVLGLPKEPRADGGPWNQIPGHA